MFSCVLMPLILKSPAVTPVASNVTRSEPSHTDIGPSEFLIQTLLFSFHPEAKEIELSLPAQTTLYWGWGEAHIDKLSRFWTLWVATFLIVCSLGCCRLDWLPEQPQNHVSHLFTWCFSGNLSILDFRVHRLANDTVTKFGKCRLKNILFCGDL